MNKPEPREVNLVHYWRILRRRWLPAAVMAAVVVVTVGVGTLMLEPIYASTATIEISPKAPMALNVQDAGELVSVRTNEERRAYYATQYKILRSRTVILMTLDTLRDEHGVTDFEIEDDPDRVQAVKAFRKVLSVKPEGDTELVYLTVEYPDAEKAALFSETLAVSYMQFNLDRAQEDSLAASARLSEQHEDQLRRKKNKEESVLRYIYENGLEGASDQKSVLQQSVDKNSSELARVANERLEVETDIKTLRTQLRSQDWLGLASHLANSDDVLQDSVQRLQKLKEERKAAEIRYREGMPIMAELDGKIAAQEDFVQEQVNQYIKGREAKHSLLVEREQTLERTLARQKEELNALNGKLLELELLRDDAIQEDVFYQEMSRRVAELDLANRIRANNVDFVDHAWVNPEPVRPSLVGNVLIGLLAGVITGVGFAFGIEYIDSTVKSREDIEEYVGVPFLGPVPQIDPADKAALPTEFHRNLYVHSRPRAAVTENLRNIRTNILFRSPDKPQRRLLITSAAPQEGKSFISSNLSAVIAMTGTRVLLIDADLRRPTQHKLFDRPNDVGLTDVLEGRVALADAVYDSPVPNLDLLVAGPHPDNPAELLGSELMTNLLDSIRGYDMIIIDSPPVGAVADPLILSRMVDGVVIAVRSNHTPRDLVMQCRTQLSQMDANILGAIVNRLDMRRSGYGYYYYYDYNSVYYEVPEEERESAS